MPRDSQEAVREQGGGEDHGAGILDTLVVAPEREPLAELQRGAGGQGGSRRGRAAATGRGDSAHPTVSQACA